MSSRIARRTAILIALVFPLTLPAQRVIPGLDAAAIDTTVKPGDNF